MEYITKWVADRGKRTLKNHIVSELLRNVLIENQAVLPNVRLILLEGHYRVSPIRREKECQSTEKIGSVQPVVSVTTWPGDIDPT